MLLWKADDNVGKLPASPGGGGGAELSPEPLRREIPTCCLGCSQLVLAFSAPGSVQMRLRKGKSLNRTTRGSVLWGPPHHSFPQPLSCGLPWSSALHAGLFTLEAGAAVPGSPSAQPAGLVPALTNAFRRSTGSDGHLSSIFALPGPSARQPDCLLAL